jgi:adenine deaminase
VIGVVPGRIITERLAMPLPSRDGEALVDLAQDASRSR